MMANYNSSYQEMQSQKLVMLTCLGTLVHWYDFYIFSFIAPLILKSYYHAQGDQLIWLSMIALAVGLLVRPIGAIFLSPKMDIIGRKALFSQSLHLMLFSNLLLLMTPFSILNLNWGIALLLIIRVLQGVSLTMEYGAASSYIFESVQESKRGFYLGLLQITAPIGFGLSLGAQYYGSQLILPEWWAQGGWRIFVLLGLPLVILSRKIRHDLQESPAFELLQKRQELEVVSILSRIRKVGWGKLIFLIFAVAAPQGASYYFSHFYFAPYFDPKWSSLYLLGAIILFWPMSLISSTLTDSFSAFKLWRINLLIMLFLLMSLAVVTAGKMWIMLGLYAMSLFTYGLVSRLLLDSFSTGLRGLGTSITYHFGNGVFGGLLGLVGLLSQNTIQSTQWALYFCLLAVAIGFALVLIPSLTKKYLIPG